VRLDILIISTVATAGLLGAGAREASAQVSGAIIQVGEDEAPLMSRPSSRSDLVVTASAGSALEALDRQDDWFWVLLPRDARGTQRAAWIYAGHVDGAVLVKPEADPAVKEAERLAKEVEKAAKEEEKRATDEEKRAAKEAELTAKAEEKARVAAEKQRIADERLQAEAQAKAEEKARKEQEAEARRMKKAEEELEKARKQYERLTSSQN
jgi:hypothetical protein